MSFLISFTVYLLLVFELTGFFVVEFEFVVEFFVDVEDGRVMSLSLAPSFELVSLPVSE